MRTGKRAWVAFLALLVALPATPPAGAAPMASGQDSRDTGHLPQFDFTKVEVQPGQSGNITVTVTNRYNQTIHSLRLEFAFQVGGDWQHARPVSEMAEPPRLDPSLVEPPHDLEAGESITLSVPFTTSSATPEGVYLVSLVARFSYTDASIQPRGAVLKSLGTVAREGNSSLVDMDNYTATLDALGIDGVAPDTSIQVNAHSAEALFWQAAIVGVVIVAAGFGAAEWMSRRQPATPHSRRRRR